MSATTMGKIQRQHQQRQALVYVRQSTTKQLAVNQESTRRQYQLAERAQALGWAQPRVVVIDDDLGLSGVGSHARAGFQRLVSAVGLGAVGGIFVTEISRLSRLNSDWHRVIELCAVFDTLIADEDGVYDPTDPNDRLVLGLKGFIVSLDDATPLPRCTAPPTAPLAHLGLNSWPATPSVMDRDTPAPPAIFARWVQIWQRMRRARRSNLARP